MTDKKQIVLRKMSADEKELYEIEPREKAVRDEVSARNYERQEGIKQGIEQCKQDFISKMKKSGMSDEQIQKILAIN